MNEILQMIPVEHRAKIYLALKILSFSLGVVTAVVLVVTGGVIPVWLAAVTAGVLALGIPTVGQIASANLSNPVIAPANHDIDPEANPEADLRAGVTTEDA